MVPETTAPLTLSLNEATSLSQEVQAQLGPDAVRGAALGLRSETEPFAPFESISVIPIDHTQPVDISFLGLDNQSTSISVLPFSEAEIPPSVLEQARKQGADTNPSALVIEVKGMFEFSYPEPSVSGSTIKPNGSEPIPLYVNLPIKAQNQNLVGRALGVRLPPDQIKITPSPTKSPVEMSENASKTPEPAFSTPNQTLVTNERPAVSQTELLDTAPADIVENRDQTDTPTFVTTAEEPTPAPQPTDLPPLATNETVAVPPLAPAIESFSDLSQSLEPVADIQPPVSQTEPLPAIPEPAVTAQTIETPPSAEAPPTPESNLPPPPEASTHPETPSPVPTNAEKHNLTGPEAQKVAAFLSEMMRSQEKNSLNGWLKAITNPKATPEDRQKNLQLFQEALQNAPAETKPLHQIALDMLQDLTNTINHYETLDKSDPIFIQDKKLLKKTYQLSSDTIQNHMNQASQAQQDWEQNQNLQGYLDYHVHIWTAHWAGQKSW